MKKQLTIGSRGSKLALWQAEWVKARLETLHPGLEVLIRIIKTSGDVMKDAPLAVIGGQGVFTKELEDALLDGRIDLAVHSLKDLPTTLHDALAIAAMTAREDPRDALVLRASLSLDRPGLRELPRGATVGTSSLRRLAQLKRLRPDVRIKELRGNVDTRLRKLDAGEYDALILAAAGLRRLGLGERISAAIPPEEILPAVGQGALGIETRAGGEVVDYLLALDDPSSRQACTAERALLRGLGGGCQLPIAAHAVVADDRLRLEALVVEVSGETMIRDHLEGTPSEAAQIGDALARRLLERGAGSLLSR